MTRFIDRRAVFLLLMASLLGCIVALSFLAGYGVGRDKEVSGTTLLPPPAVIERVTYTGVDVFEDGSGTQYINGRSVRSFPADTFRWTCEDMGNRSCAPTTTKGP